MKRYGTIVVDPPWKYTKTPTEPRGPGAGASAEHYYPTMRSEAIAALPVGELAADVCHLYVWVTNPILTEQRPDIRGSATAMDVVRAWGFEPKTLLTWEKTGPVGMGFYFRGQTEHVIFATRGREAGIPPELRQPNIFRAPRGRHSEKPDVFIDRVERVSPAPRIELFARRARFGWDYWGNEALENAGAVLA
jgi:N6-adenosine-specific RNA methylase IME4